VSVGGLCALVVVVSCVSWYLKVCLVQLAIYIAMIDTMRMVHKNGILVRFIIFCDISSHALRVAYVYY
jgi:hypothetical protein